MKKHASLSLDLDNLWSYMRIHGDTGWDGFPSYLDLVVPRVLDFLKERDLRITFFVVGKDASLDRNREALQMLAAAGHEVGNHSFHHEPWFKDHGIDHVDEEIATAAEAIERATGRVPEGFRSPGFSVSPDILSVLAKRGYGYDASTLPTFIGPLARAYYFMTSNLGREERKERSALFGTVRDGARPVGAYRWNLGDRELVEVPVTTFPFIRVPFHLSYVLYLGTRSKTLARWYFRAALKACLMSGVEPSVLLHPLDFLGGDDAKELAFFPAMSLSAPEKMEMVGLALDDLSKSFEVLPMGEHVASLRGRDLPSRIP